MSHGATTEQPLNSWHVFHMVLHAFRIFVPICLRAIVRVYCFENSNFNDFSPRVILLARSQTIYFFPYDLYRNNSIFLERICRFCCAQSNFLRQWRPYTQVLTSQLMQKIVEFLLIWQNNHTSM